MFANSNAEQPKGSLHGSGFRPLFQTAPTLSGQGNPGKMPALHVAAIGAGGRSLVAWAMLEQLEDLTAAKVAYSS